MKFFQNVYQYVNILSLDVVAGALISSLFFARLFGVSVQANALAALALTVWIIYTLDHLRDAMIIPKVASTDRHRFHQRHFRFITIVLIVVVAVDFILIWTIDKAVLQAGMILGLIVLVYLLLQRHLKFLKEFFVACLYTAGILLPSLALAHAEPQTVHYIVIGKFFVTALMNLLLFSLFDFNEDRDQQQHSFVTWFGPSSTWYGILFLGTVNILSGIRLWAFDATVALIFISMNAVLLTILFFPGRLASKNHYRMLGDAVFFIPVLYIL